MRRLAILAIVALTSCFANLTWAEERRSIDSYSITALHIKPTVQQDKNMRVCSFISNLDGYVPLRKPSEERNVAILKVESNSDCILNPIGRFDYGPIPLLSKMTVEVADQLWGSTGNSNPNMERTYHLVSIKEHGGSEDFFLDTVFANGQLKQYRIRSKSLVYLDVCNKKVQISPEWHQVLSDN